MSISIPPDPHVGSSAILGTRKYCNDCGRDFDVERGHKCPAHFYDNSTSAFQGNFDPFDPKDCGSCGGIYIPAKGHACPALVKPGPTPQELDKIYKEEMAKQKAEYEQRQKEWREHMDAIKKTPAQIKEDSESLWEKLRRHGYYPSPTETRNHEEHIAELDRQIAEQS